MLVKILGGIDVILSVILIFLNSLDLPFQILWVFGIFLIIKGAIGFFKDFATWIDGFAGLILLLSIIFPISSVICAIAGLLLLQKGVFSFL